MDKTLEVPLASFDFEALVELAGEIGVSAEDVALFFISREVVHTSKYSPASRPLLFLPEGGSHLEIVSAN